MHDPDTKSPPDAPAGPAKSSGSMLRLPAADLQIGMYICELDRPWLGTPFAFQGFPLETEDDLVAVRQHCDHALVDVAQSDPRAFQSALHEHAGPPPVSLSRRQGLLGRLLGWLKRGPSDRQLATGIHHAVQHAVSTVEETEKLVLTIMDDVRLGKVINTPAVKTAVSETVDRIIRDQDAMLLLSSIKDKDHYTREHSLNVAILAIILGRKLNMPRHKLEELGMAGLLHDVGKVLTPDEILKKPGRLTAEEFLVMKMHPVQGRDILHNSGITGVPLEVAYGHHERLDGSGYPRGLKETQTPISIRIAAIADTFDAITSDRVYGSGRTNIEAFEVLRAGGGNHFDSVLVSAFVDAIGVYPPGTVVQLSNGDIGIVVRTHPDSRLRPVVLILKDRQLRPVSPRYVDLAATAKPTRDTLHIAHMLRAKDAGVDSQVFRDQRLLAVLDG